MTSCAPLFIQQICDFLSNGLSKTGDKLKCIDKSQINEINVDLRTSGFDNEALSVDACAVWWEHESFYCLPRIGVVTWHREPRCQCGSAQTGSIWNSSIRCFLSSKVSVLDSLLTCSPVATPHLPSLNIFEGSVALQRTFSLWLCTFPNWPMLTVNGASWKYCAL